MLGAVAVLDAVPVNQPDAGGIGQRDAGDDVAVVGSRKGVGVAAAGDEVGQNSESCVTQQPSHDSG